MRLLLQGNELAERGTTRAIWDYASYLTEFTGYEPVIAYDRTAAHTQAVVERFFDRFEVFSYDRIEDLHAAADRANVDAAYIIKSGELDDRRVDGVPNYVHAVFRRFQPHGDRYAYVSQWLAEFMWRITPLQRRLLTWRGVEADVYLDESQDRSAFAWVPHIVNPVTPASTRGDVRAALGIPEDAFVLGSLSGRNEFNIEFVRKWMPNFLAKSASHYFVAPNIDPFIDHPRALFLPTIVEDQLKSDYLNSLDVLLHARARGETFGLAMCEALALGIPVVSCRRGRDRNHVRILSETGWMYGSVAELDAVVENLKTPDETRAAAAQRLTAAFRPAPVMSRFRAMFTGDAQCTL